MRCKSVPKRKHATVSVEFQRDEWVWRRYRSTVTHYMVEDLAGDIRVVSSVAIHQPLTPTKVAQGVKKYEDDD